MSTPTWIRDIPRALLFQHNTTGLRQWLYDRGRRLSLLDLDAERRSRRNRRRLNHHA